VLIVQGTTFLEYLKDGVGKGVAPTLIDVVQVWRRFNRTARLLIYPAAVPETEFELPCDCIGGRLGSSLERIPAARLAINLHSAHNDQAYRIARRNRDRGRRDHSWHLVSGRAHRPRSEFLQALGRHHVALHYGI
jgi:hypothetical protein